MIYTIVHTILDANWLIVATIEEVQKIQATKEWLLRLEESYQVNVYLESEKMQKQ